MNDQEKIAELEQKLNFLANKERRQAKLTELISNKFFAMQEYLISSRSQQICPIGDPGASLFPIEGTISPDRPVTVIAFAGMNTRLSLPSAEFLRILSAFDVNVVLVKDFRQCWYMTGLLGISDDVPGTAAHLKQLVAASRRVVCLGTSAGAFAAILFGRLMGADHIMAFSPQTEINDDVTGQFRNLETRGIDLEKVGEYADLQQFLNQTPGCLVDLHYARGNATDHKAALRLIDCPNVRVTSHDHFSHNVVSWLRDHKQLDPILQAAFFPDQPATS